MGRGGSKKDATMLLNNKNHVRDSMVPLKLFRVRMIEVRRWIWLPETDYLWSSHNHRI